MKAIVSLLFILAVTAFSSNSQYEWTDENGCSYCLYGYYKDGKCVHTSRNWCDYCSYYYDFFNIRELKSNYFLVDYPYRSSFHVYCENSENYCKTINDSMAVKLMPSLKERKTFCSEQQKKGENKGMFYDMPIYHDDIVFLCDFVKFNYKKSFFEVMNSGTCPVRVNRGLTGVFRTIAYYYGNLYVTRMKKNFKIDNVELFLQKIDNQKQKNRFFHKKDFFTLGDCSNSNCEILNYIGGKPQDFDIKCDFIKKDGNEGKVKVFAAGVCPIEVLDKDNKKQVYRVRSVKDGDGYKLLMTNKRK